MYFAKVNGFSPLFVSKSKLAKFINDDKKAYRKTPICKSPKAKARKAKLAAMWAATSVPANHPSAAFFPVAA